MIPIVCGFYSSWNSRWHKRKRQLLISATLATVQTKEKAEMPGHILDFSKLCIQVRNQSIHFSRCSFYVPHSFPINGMNKSPNIFKESQEILHMQLFIEISIYTSSPFHQGLRIYVKKEAERLLTIIGGGWLWGNNVFKTK